MLTIPDVRQRGEFDCGLACVVAAARFLGKRPSYDRFGDLVDPVRGMEPDVVVAALASLGLGTLAGRMPGGLADLQHYTRLGLPVLAPITVEAVGHWVVVRGVARGRVYVHDPSWRGPRSVRLQSWLDAWRDYTVSGHECTNWGIVVSK